MLKRISLVLVIGAVLGWRYVSMRDEPSVKPPRDVASVPRSEAPAALPEVTVQAPAAPVAPTPAPAAPALGKADLKPLDLLALKRHHAPVRTVEDRPATPLARYSHLGLGRVTRVNERPYRVLGARAVRIENYSSSLGPVLFEENGLRVVEDRSPGWNDLVVGAGTQALMVNPANGRLVVVTGTLKVSVADADQAQALASDEKLHLIQYDPSIKLAFLKAPPGYALLPALKRLSERAGVTLVELEAVEGRAVPR